MDTFAILPIAITACGVIVVVLLVSVLWKSRRPTDILFKILIGLVIVAAFSYPAIRWYLGGDTLLQPGDTLSVTGSPKI